MRKSHNPNLQLVDQSLGMTQTVAYTNVCYSPVMAASLRHQSQCLRCGNVTRMPKPLAHILRGNCMTVWLMFQSVTTPCEFPDGLYWYPKNALKQIVEAQILQENQGLRRIAKKLLKSKIHETGTNLHIDNFKRDRTTLTSHPIDICPSTLSDDMSSTTEMGTATGFLFRMITSVGPTGDCLKCRSKQLPLVLTHHPLQCPSLLCSLLITLII